MVHSLCETDVFIAGGGPAGLAAAIAVRQAGYSVTVVDPATPPIDKACGEGIMPNGRRALEELGVGLPLSAGAPFHGIRFVEGSLVADARFRSGHGLGVRRTVLHEALIRQAVAQGVAVHWGTRVSGLMPEGVIVNGHGIRCRWVVGADGHNSSIRQWAGLSAAGRERKRFGFRWHYPVAPWSEFVEVYWERQGQIYVTPVDRQAVCVACISGDPHLRLRDALAQFPQLAKRLEGIAPITREQGGVSVSRRMRRVYQGNRLLLGDASGSVDAITGEGLSLAFQQALALRDALRTGSLAHYQGAHRRIARMPRMMGSLLLTMGDLPWFRQRVLRAFSNDPSLFPGMLGMHTDDVSLQEFGLGGVAALLWNLLIASPAGASQETVHS